MKRKGITRIELLVVIVVAALLLAIGVPSLTARKQHSATVVCLVNQRSLAQAWLMYCDDNDTRFCSGFVEGDALTRDPPSWVKAPLQYDSAGNQVFVGGGDVGGFLLNQTARDNGIRQGALYPYLGSTKMFHCPADERLGVGAVLPNEPPGLPTRYYQIYRSYGMPDFYDCGGNGIQTSVANIEPPEEKMLFVGFNYDRRYYNIDTWSYIPGDHKYWDPLANFHDNGCTFSFVDGHAELYKWKDRRSIIFMSDRALADQLGFGKGDVQVGNPDFDWLDAHYPSENRY